MTRTTTSNHKEHWEPLLPPEEAGEYSRIYQKTAIRMAGGSSEETGEVLSATGNAMAQASDLVLDGFVLRADVNIVRYPNRYPNNRGVERWNRMMGLLDCLEFTQ
jgi:hypothetical protein